MAGTSTTRGAPPPMAAGGTTGQVLTKASNNSYDTEWTTPAGGGGTVTDVTASAPLSSTGGATPDISIGGGTAGQVLTSNGASAPTFEDLPAPPTVPSASSSNGTSIGTAAPGVSTDYARGDHVHDGSLADLDDVSATVPTAGQVLAWAGAEWAPATPAAVPAASNSTPAGLGTAAVGVSTDYARADHVHAGTVAALTDRYEELPSQTFSEFAHASAIAASPTRDIQTAIDATPVGPACQVIVGPGSYGGATVTIPAGRNNISIIGPSAGDFGGTIASLSASRALTIGNNAVRVRIVSLQVEGLTTVSTTGAGVHRFEQCQLIGGLTLGAISGTVYVVGCEVGAVTIPAGFTGIVLFDRCLFTGSITNNATAPLTRCSISDSAGGIAAPTTAATINGRWQVGTSTTFFAGGSALLGAPLTAINSLTPAADRIAYYTSASAGAMTALTAFGRSLIDDVDAAAARTTLGLGTAATQNSTAFQTADATLTALAGLTTAADRVPYFTGVDTAAVATITTAGREILSTATSGTNGQVLTSSGGGAPTWTTVSGGGGAGAINVQAYTADATWTKPAGAQFVEVIAIGGGGGGGSGRLGAASSTRGGGAGGGGAGITRWMVPAAALGATVAVTVGAGGAGGAPVLTSGVSGAAGTAGTASTFGSHVYAAGGAGGAGGAGTTAPVGGAGATAAILAGGNGGNGGAGATGGPTVGLAALGAAGGGGGGSVTSGNTAQAGQTGGAGSPFFAGASALAGGAGGAATGVSGSAGTSSTSSQPFGGGGGGGGGANHVASGSAIGGTGGVGGSYGAGGGGGGGGTTSTASGQSGEGGAGASGIIYVITY